MASVSVSRTAAGLFSNVNAYSATPEGALLEATNVVIEREGTISKRRGVDRFGQELPGVIERIMEYRDRLIVHDGTTLRFDSSGLGAWTAWGGTYRIPEEGDASRMHAVEYKDNFYFTADTGIYKNDSLTTNPTLSGMPPGLDTQATLTGTGAGFFTAGLQCAYRIIWGRVDRNFQLVLGAPSTSEVISNPLTTALAWSRVTTTCTVTQTAHGYATNDIIEITDTSDATAVPNGSEVITVTGSNTYTFTCLNAGATSGTLTAGKKFNVALTFTIPDGILAEDFYEIYRTDLFALAGDRCLKIKRVVVQAADLTKKVVSFTDTTDSAFLGEDLYTNAEVEGLTQANTRPPWAKDIAVFNESCYYSNTMREEAIEFRLLATTGIIEGTDAVTFTDSALAQTYTSATSESAADGNGNIAGRQWKCFEADSTVPLESQKVERSIKSLIRVINRDPNNSKFYAFYISGPEDAPGAIRIERRTVNTGAFYVTANSAGFAAKWTPGLATSGNSLGSDNNRGKNLLVWSKFDQPEAVPEVNAEPVGAEQYEILRILRIKGSLIILKEDGVWRASGAPKSPPQIDQLDPTVRCVAPEAACVLDDAVWCLSTLGVVRITENGTEIVSDPVDDSLQSTIFRKANYKYTTLACAYESAQEFLLITPGTDLGSGNVPEVVLAYNYQSGPQKTGAWYLKYDRGVSAAYVPLKEDKLYLADERLPWILQERKTTAGILFDDTNDYQDEELADEATVTAVTTGTDAYGTAVSVLTVTFVAETADQIPVEGWGFSQAGSDSKILSVTRPIGTFDTYVLTLSMFDALYTTGAASLIRGISSRIRWAPEEGDTVALIKRWQEIHVALQSEATGSMLFRLGFKTDIRDESTSGTISEEFFVDNIRRTFYAGYPYEFLRVAPLPMEVQRSRSIGLIFEHHYNNEPWHILNVAYKYLPTGSRVSIANQ